MESISVFGLGRVGLITAVCLAKRGYKVIGVDTDPRRVRQVKNGEAPFFESNLLEYIREVVGNATLSTTSDFSSTAQCDLAFITVGTPSNRDGTINLTQVKNAAKMIGRVLRNKSDHQLVVIKSTVTPGTARNTVKPLLERQSSKKAGKHFELCSNPEFLREGKAIHDTESPDRIVIGSEHPEAIRDLEGFYREFHRGNPPPIIRTTHENAELIKYATNAFLATKVSFVNCISNIADRIPHTDVKVIAAGIGMDQRISPQFLNAGLGWGGSCLPKDIRALVTLSTRLGYSPKIIEATVSTNRDQWRKAVQLAKRTLGALRGRRLAVLGLSFKPDTDDMRAAVSIPIIRALLREGASIVAYDPAAMDNARAIFGDRITYAKDAVSCIKQTDCCVLITEWDEFKTIPPQTFVNNMRRPVVIDGRRVYDRGRFLLAGIRFSAIGLGPDAT